MNSESCCAGKHSDAIHNPSHYTVYPVQPIEISRHLGFCLGNAVKYILRAPFKGGVEDCDKALKYLEWEEDAPQSALACPEYFDVSAKIDELAGHLRMLSANPDTPVQPWMEEVADRQADFLESLSGYLERGEARYIAHMRMAAGYVAAAIVADRCRVCGCTDARACEGGCYWVEEDLCSACAGKIRNDTEAV